MDQQTYPSSSGSYTANLLGNIKSHLAALQGYDVMALELLQNADDAKAEIVTFDVTDKGLFVVNSGEFTYCGNLHNRPCAFSATKNYSCDYHRIADVGSGGKLSRSDNIGRFGIGFVSTYQITDHPEIQSSGIKLVLHPEKGQWFSEPLVNTQGTTFFLPWADDPNTEARLALGLSHISSEHIEQLVDDFQKVLRKSLLFLRHIRTAELRRNGKLLLACDLDRDEESELIISFRPSGEIERWHILRTDASEAAAQLHASHPRLESLGRGTKISIGLRVDPESLTEGLLYAFLPTEQSTGLPLHINADFFPESDRKAVIFAGHQHEQAWNEMLIDAAAAELAKDPEHLLTMLGHAQFWQIFARAYELSRSSNHPACFKRFWERLKVTGAQAHITLAYDGSVQCPSDVFLPRTPLISTQANTLLEIGGRLVAENLRSFQTAINQLGAPILTFDRLVALLEQAMAKVVAGELKIEIERLENFYRPLWGMVNDLLPDATNQTPTNNLSMKRLLGIPFIVTEDLYVVTIDQTYVVPAALEAGRIASLLPRLAIAAQDIIECPKIARLFDQLDLGGVVRHIETMCTNEPMNDVIGVEQQELHDLYEMFADLDRYTKVDKAVYQALRNLPIWLSSRGLTKASQALLPGNFTDPTGQADLLDTTVLSTSAREFVSSKLDVQTQTIEAFVQSVLPRFFNENGPLDTSKYARLIGEIANYPSLVNDESIRLLLRELPIIPTKDGNWSRPTKTYRRTDDLVKVLGDATSLWLDDTRIPNTRSVHSFIDSIGLRSSPMAEHLVERMIFIAEKYPPTEDANRSSSYAFYVLCDHYDEWKEKPFFRTSIRRLSGMKCFPAEGDTENWYLSSDLYAPYRAEAFRSQAKILDFKNTIRLKTDLLQDLNVTINPEINLVLGHLQHCVNTGLQPHVLTYQVLNEHAQRSDPHIAILAESRCIYVESQKNFVRPNQLYWLPQQLGRYAFTIPGILETFKPLFTAIGVKNTPEGRDYIDILLDIVGEYYEQSKPISGVDRSVYETCLIGIAASDEQDEISVSDIQRLQEAPSILNLSGHPTHPDEVLLQDSEWHVGFFNEDLDRALCKAAPELWPLIEKVGVRRLSESTEVTLEMVDGHQIDEPLIAKKLIERIDILARLLHDKPTMVKQKVRCALSELTSVSYELVHIQASVNVGGDWVSAPPTPVYAFYDINKRQLILTRPIGDRSWSHALNAIFHQLMPKESGSEISKLTLSLRPLMSMSVEEAHSELTDAGIPHLDIESSAVQIDDLTSSSLEDMGGAIDPSYQPESNQNSSTGETSQVGESNLDPMDSKQRTSESHISDKYVQPTQQNQRNTRSADIPNKDYIPTEHSTIHSSKEAPTSDPQTRKPRPKHKEQWDRRLLSYVRQKQENSSDTDSQDKPSEHNLAVEVVSRAAVCAYEKARGRIAEQMAQTHPGYDIISRDSLTGVERFIEVKGVNGEWNQTGVGLSRLQFSNAQDYGDRYWLYVVEFVSDPEHTRIYPICSPATQVTSFMFDGNWRDAVAEVDTDPALLFIVGARVKHQNLGIRRIQSVELRGLTRFMSIKFESCGQRKVTLNLQTMSVIEEDDDNNHS